jgi:hypothetical protein
VLAEARGKYFTWLAADDVLSSQEYARRCVAVLERLPDVVLCATAMTVLDYESPGSVATVAMGAISEERRWAETRLEFFRCPYRDGLYFAFYGVYRRDALARVPLDERRHRDEAVVLDMEYPVLARLSLGGRIVGLPDPLRSYRCREDSVGFLSHELLSATAKTWLSLRMKLTLLRIAAASGRPARDRLRATGVALANFLATTSRVKPLKNEIALLRRACRERLDLITRLTATADDRLRRIDSLQAIVEAQARRIEELEGSRRR